MPTTDDVLLAKTTARRRLLGAALLLLVIALLLPHFLNKKAPEVVQAVDIRVATPTTPVQPDVSNSTKLLGDSTQSDHPVQNDAPIPSGAPDKQPSEKPQEPVAPVITTANVTQPLPQPEKKPAPIIITPPATATPAPTAEWVLQLGVFKDKANAEKTAALAKKHNLKPRIESISDDNNTTKYVVRSGPYKTRAAADDGHDKLLKAKIKSLVLPANP